MVLWRGGGEGCGSKAKSRYYCLCWKFMCCFWYLVSFRGYSDKRGHVNNGHHIWRRARAMKLAICSYFLVLYMSKTLLSLITLTNQFFVTTSINDLMEESGWYLDCNLNFIRHTRTSEPSNNRSSTMIRCKQTLGSILTSLKEDLNVAVKKIEFGRSHVEWWLKQGNPSATIQCSMLDD